MPLRSEPEATHVLPSWAPRVPREKIERLYLQDARGILEADLIEDVGISLYARCDSILTATEAAKGRLRCPQCGMVIRHRTKHSREEQFRKILHCSDCKWTVPWSVFIRSYRKKQLSAGGMAPFFRQYLRDYPRASTPKAKMILIDQLIHRYHHELENRPGRMGGVNLIQGKMTDVREFLRNLTYSKNSTPELLRTHDAWLTEEERRAERSAVRRKSR